MGKKNRTGFFKILKKSYEEFKKFQLEEKKKEVEADLELAIRKGRSCGMSNEELMYLFQMFLED